MEIKRADPKDAEELYALQKLAYTAESNLYGGIPIPPLTETADEIRAKFRNYLFLKAVEGGKIVGSVRVLQEEGTCHVGRLMVHPNYQNRGIATKLLLQVERVFAMCGRFELFTGDRSAKNLRLYEKLGYRRFKTEQPTGKVQLVFLEKTR